MIRREDNFDDDVVEKKKKVTKNSYFVQIHNSFVRNPDLNIKEKMLYIYIMGFGNCFVSQHTMEKDLGVSKPTLRAALTSLSKKGYIHIQHRTLGDTNASSTNMYRYIPVDDETGKPYEKVMKYYKDKYE